MFGGKLRNAAEFYSVAKKGIAGKIIKQKGPRITKTCLPSMVVDAADKACNVPTSIWAYDKTLGFSFCQKKSHQAVTIIRLMVLKVINITSVFRDDCHIFYQPISFYCKTVKP